MRQLRLVALSDDGKSLVLALDGAEPGEEGERFELPIDERVRAAARGDARRLGQIDVEIGATLPPRVIQARIRAGETPEQVAHASGIQVERIMRFAHPVLQERERVAEQAREARVRLSEGTPSVPLQQFMSERLRLLGADLDAVRWDAHRAGDGVWQVTAAWQAGAKSGVTRWAYDIPAAHRRPGRRRHHRLRRGHPPGARRPARAVRAARAGARPAGLGRPRRRRRRRPRLLPAGPRRGRRPDRGRRRAAGAAGRRRPRRHAPHRRGRAHRRGRHQRARHRRPRPSRW
jgi:hypothetical protein